MQRECVTRNIFNVVASSTKRFVYLKNNADLNYTECTKFAHAVQHIKLRIRRNFPGNKFIPKNIFFEALSQKLLPLLENDTDIKLPLHLSIIQYFMNKKKD